MPTDNYLICVPGRVTVITVPRFSCSVSGELLFSEAVTGKDFEMFDCFHCNKIKVQTFYLFFVVHMLQISDLTAILA